MSWILRSPSTDPGISPIGIKDEMIVATPYPDRLRLAGVMELTGSGQFLLTTGRVGCDDQSGRKCLFLACRPRAVHRKTWGRDFRPCVCRWAALFVGTYPRSGGCRWAHWARPARVWFLAPITSAIVSSTDEGAQPGNTVRGVRPLVPSVPETVSDGADAQLLPKAQGTSLIVIAWPLRSPPQAASSGV
jgi:hypothetical protein